MCSCVTFFIWFENEKLAIKIVRAKDTAQKTTLLVSELLSEDLRFLVCVRGLDTVGVLSSDFGPAFERDLSIFWTVEKLEAAIQICIAVAQGIFIVVKGLNYGATLIEN
jgi:hypothetical protein